MESSTKTPRQKRVVLLRNWRKVSAYSVVSQEVGGESLACQLSLMPVTSQIFEFYFKYNGNHGRFLRVGIT